MQHIKRSTRIKGALLVLCFVCIQGCTSQLSTTEPTNTSDAATEKAPVVEKELMCNGAALLCDRAYNDVAYATTHNAMSAREENWQAPNQQFGITKQLEDGIRGLMLDVHMWKDKPYLCHGANSEFCALGNLLLTEGLTRIKQFLDTHPHEVITIIFENYAPFDALKQAFEDAKTLTYTHTQATNAPWPTLRELIRTNKRLVVFTDKEGGKAPWLHDVWKYAWETHWKAESTQELNCKKNRGDSPENKLFILNHFVSKLFPSKELSKEANSNPFFIKRAQECQQQSGQLPNFVTVDYYDIGDVFEVVKTLNGLQ
ncbi:MAG: hypothetical protein CL920_13580 [Deltaproteobacteria bacterium]|nr:hypothetical protein [Deltaproteobacteria bacterium]MBU49721.1 hypothetical protein [Deltaproteobacteria bacterium]